MKLITGILAVTMMTAAAWGQNPDAIDNARSVAKSLQQIKTNETNAALAASDGPAQQADQPAAASPAQSATGQPAGPKAAPAGKATKPHDAFKPKKKAVASAKLAATKPSA